MQVGDLVEVLLLNQVMDIAIITEVLEDGGHVVDGVKVGKQILPPDFQGLREVA